MIDTADLAPMATVPDVQQPFAARPGAACANDSAPAHPSGPQDGRSASRGVTYPRARPPAMLVPPRRAPRQRTRHASALRSGGRRPGVAARCDGRARRPGRRGGSGELGRPVRDGARGQALPGLSALEAGIPDAGALIFAALGIALALHGRRAPRSRVLNVACVAISLAMNAMAAEHGWRNVADPAMPAAIYALASDTLIGVVRAWALARMQATGDGLAGEEVTPLTVAGTCLLWLLRLALAPASTLAGFRRWVVEECPIAPGRKAPGTNQPIEIAPLHDRSWDACRSAAAVTASRGSRTC